MKRVKVESSVPMTRLTLIQALMAVLLVYLLFMSLEIPLIFKTGYGSVPGDGSLSDALPRPILADDDEATRTVLDPHRVFLRIPERRVRETKRLSGLFFNESIFDAADAVDELSALHKAAKQAWLAGKKLWEELESADHRAPLRTDSGVPHNGGGESEVGPPGEGPANSVAEGGEEALMVSQFMMELLGLKTVDGEEPPRILHFNPRLKGDWSGKPVIEHNTCYRMQWGTPLRCEGWSSQADEETVDGLVKCEKWLRDDDSNSEDSKVAWWLNRLIGRQRKISFNWPFPFAEGKLFVLTLSTGLEGYHINVDGRHITSFPYRTGFVLEDATGLYLNGDVDVHSVFAASLPSLHPSVAPQQHLEMFRKWQAPPLLDGQVELFIGILSAGNHFAERMAVRKTWMQHKLIRSSKVAARFFVALNGGKEINAQLKKEADFFGDIVIVPYMDNYDLVVLKTVAICEYGVHNMAAKYIMKCDDDTFVRVEAMIQEAKKVPRDGSLYIGNINYYHKVFRSGKWAVTYEEWPAEEYPPYANGPGYIISSDIAQFVVAEFQSHQLRLFKMEDVSMGIWVEKFNGSKPVEYVHSLKFCQYGCTEDYYTAHYQSPRQMLCLWEKYIRENPNAAI
ncbi:hypothetical protein GH714_036322 [Hevea brasiliensis]|uniref:Galectin domain-containing protein n=1 Tax=Hevea brasiliensis TaxID=3981 RepID=A0A6A6LPR1_HEVBR|nr:hypothetical protein GH714_036322 [Hevea brasiliensis]